MLSLKTVAPVSGTSVSETDAVFNLSFVEAEVFKAVVDVLPEVLSSTVFGIQASSGDDLSKACALQAIFFLAALTLPAVMDFLSTLGCFGGLEHSGMDTSFGLLTALFEDVFLVTLLRGKFSFG